ncbi:MAG: L-lactate permease [Veillonella sp.]|nr:L-lactate permease [Veillonella sp.]
MDLLTTFLALLPILWLIIALAILKMPAWKATTIAAIGSFVIAVVPGLPFAKDPSIIFSGALEGAALAIWPICLVILAAIFTYNLVVKTGAMETIKSMLSSVTEDKRILAVLLVWGFGNFMEGMAGFGTAVAIPAAMMVAVGFNPLKSIIACLVANAVPTTFGSIGIPTTTLAALTGINPVALGTYISSQLFILNIITPFFIVAIMFGVKALKGVFIPTLLAGLALAVPELFINVVLGPELSVIGSAVIILALVIATAKIFDPKDPTYRLEGAESQEKLSAGQCLRALSPFILIFILLLLASKLFAPFNGFLTSIKTSIPIYMGEGAKPYTFVWVTTPGVLIFIAAIIGGLIQKASLGTIFGTAGKTFSNLKFTFLTIITIVMTAKIMTYSGMTQDIAKAIVSATGSMYPAFAPIVGALGAFITGSGTNSNVLFGPLQSAAASQLSTDKDLAMWLVAINSGAAGIGKMLSPQSIAIAIGAVLPALEEFNKRNNVPEAKAKEGQEAINPSSIMKKVFIYFILFLVMDGIIAFFGHNFAHLIDGLL